MSKAFVAGRETQQRLQGQGTAWAGVHTCSTEHTTSTRPPTRPQLQHHDCQQHKCYQGGPPTKTNAHTWLGRVAHFTPPPSPRFLSWHTTAPHTHHPQSHKCDYKGACGSSAQQGRRWEGERKWHGVEHPVVPLQFRPRISPSSGQPACRFPCPLHAAPHWAHGMGKGASTWRAQVQVEERGLTGCEAGGGGGQAPLGPTPHPHPRKVAQPARVLCGAGCCGVNPPKGALPNRPAVHVVAR